MTTWTRRQRVHLAILSCASAIVPRADRREWKGTWQAELWQVHRAWVYENELDLAGELEVARFCFGAFPDAICLRKQVRGRLLPSLPPRGSAGECFLSLLSLALVCGAFFWMLPGARSLLNLTQYHDSRNLILIGDSTSLDAPVVRADQFRLWKKLDQHLFADFAFYQPAAKTVHFASHSTARLTIARSSSNLIDLIGLRVRFAVPPDTRETGLPRLILTERAWKKYCPKGQVFGAIVRVGLRKAVVSGLVSDPASRFPGDVEGWLLEPDGAAASVSDESMGFVVARITQYASEAGLGGDWPVLIATPDGGVERFLCVSVAQRFRTPWNIFVFTLVLALLALPATTPLGLGEYPGRRHKLSLKKRLRRWVFLATKVGLVLTIVGLGSLDLAYSSGLQPVGTQYIQLLCSFSGCLFAMRWALRDQRRRCPVCLRALTNPAEVGQKSRNFLAWYGTELICNEGHGLLHVPELPTSWFSTQRWLYLDSSWEVLFTEPRLLSTGSS